jgi:AraC-like DNA-binding protein
MMATDEGTGRDFQERFFAAHPDARSVMELFEHLPGAFFYAKDTASRYVKVNRAVLTGIFRLEREEDLLGRTDREFQPPALAEAYLAEDRRVMERRAPIPNQLWFVPQVRGVPGWYVSTKAPLFGPDGAVVGIAGVMYPVATPEDQARRFQELAPVIRHIEGAFPERVSMAAMARLAGLSPTHFNRRFRALLKMTPSEYVLQRRVEEARRRLTETAEPVGEVGIGCGFYDQSQFTRMFRRVTGLTPLQYRKRFR